MVRRVSVTGKVKHFRCEAEAKASPPWRTEPTPVEMVADEVWVAEKFQSNPEIAGSLRNSFRASLDIDYRG